MTAGAGDGDDAILSPDEAFSVLGDETRIEILQTLGEAADPLSFTELRNRVGIAQGGRFNYHLDRLVGHFVAKTDAGYALRQAGRRVVQAVLSGALTTDPQLEPTGIEFDCRLCGASVKLGYSQERVELYCTACAGQYGETAKSRESIVPGDHGILGGYPFPPAGVKNRTPREALFAASTWGHLETISLANDVCPRCADVVEHTIRVCEDHDRSAGLCPDCDRRHAVQIYTTCSNCFHQADGMAINRLIGSPELRAFVAEHGLDPIAEGVKWGWDYTEEVVSTEPFEGRFTFTIGDEALTLTVDEDLDTVEVTRHDGQPAAVE